MSCWMCGSKEVGRFYQGPSWRRNLAALCHRCAKDLFSKGHTHVTIAGVNVEHVNWGQYKEVTEEEYVLLSVLWK